MSISDRLDEITVGAGDEGTPVHRWVSEWKEA